VRHTLKLKKLNAASFPIQYPETFYKQIIHQNDVKLSKLAYWRSSLVGAICTFIPEKEVGDGEKDCVTPSANLCIMTLAVYAPYRGKGIGSRLLQTVLDCCPQKCISTVTLHVHVSNHDAIRFYTDRFGFETVALVRNYYRRLLPPDCYRLCKKLIVDESHLEDEDTSSPDKKNPN
jgi:ribosomal protein S18 acetylase RimI-like enzyme